MSAKFKKLRTLHRERGLLTAAQSIGRSLLSLICDYQVQEVRGRVIAARDPEPKPGEIETELATECVVLETGDSLDRFAAEFSQPFRDTLDALQKRLDLGCTLILARRAREDEGGKEIAGYSIMERGGFSAAGIKGKISRDISFVHHTEVARAYRGQRIAQVISRTRNEYCRKHGITKSCTAHTTGNVPSERAFRKFGSRLLCHAVRVSFFRGLFVYQTPWRKIERAITGLDGEEALRGSRLKKQVEV